jgi:hypothetical protein
VREGELGGWTYEPGEAIHARLSHSLNLSFCRRPQRLEERDELDLLTLTQLGITSSGISALAAVKANGVLQGWRSPIM